MFLCVVALLLLYYTNTLETQSQVAGVKGIEPLVAVLETAVFPLHYTPIIGVGDRNQTYINGFAIRRIIILPRQHGGNNWT